MANENIAFGWNNEKYELSNSIYSTSDRFLAIKAKAKNQNYFKDLSNKNIRVTLGYHYEFEKEYLKKNIKLNIEKTTNTMGNINSIIDNRADITVVPDILIPLFCKDNHFNENIFLISDTQDNFYHMSFVSLKRSSKISMTEFNNLLNTLESNGELDKLRLKYHLKK